MNHLGSFVQKSPGAGEDGQPRRAVRSHQHPAVPGEGLHQGQRQEQGFIQFATFLTWNRYLHFMVYGFGVSLIGFRS